MLARLREDTFAYLLLSMLLTAMLATTAGDFAFESLSVRFVIDLMICFGIGTAIQALDALVLSRLGLERRRPLARILLQTPVVCVGILVGVEGSLWLARSLFPQASSDFPRFGVLPVALAATIAMMAIGASRERLKRRAEELDLRETQRERELLKSQLAALQARTDPHFLFNSLNTVASLIGEDPERAERAVERLAGLFRYTLDSERRAMVALSEEIAAVEAYLEFARLRFGARLETQVALDPDAGSVSVPPFILQPLVENAIQHGVSTRPGPARVVVTAKRVEASVELTVEDDGPGPGASAHRGAGTSRTDLEQRLALAYGTRAEVTSGRGPLGGFRIELRLPVEEGEPDADPDRR